jgi:hypothetical protein
MELSVKKNQIEPSETGRSKPGARIGERTTDSLGIERNVAAASGAVFLVGIG